MRGLIYGLGAVVALAIAAPAFAGDLTSIEVDPSGKAIAVKKEPGKLRSLESSRRYRTLAAYRTRVSTMGHSIKCHLTALISAKASM